MSYHLDSQEDHSSAQDYLNHCGIKLKKTDRK